MTQPKDARQDGDNRIYRWKDEDYVSVTTVLNVLNKPALVPWAAKMSAIYAVEHRYELACMYQDGKFKEAQKLIANARLQTVDDSSKVGDDAHCAISDYIEGRMAFYDVPHLEQFKAWEAAFRPKYLFSEATIYNRSHRYAGSFDILCHLNDENWLIDVKTGNNVYPETALQLAGYAHGEFIGKDGEELQLPTVERAGVLHVRPDFYNFIPMRIDNSEWACFIHCRAIHAWMYEAKNSVMLDSMKGKASDDVQP